MPQLDGKGRRVLLVFLRTGYPWAHSERGRAIEARPRMLANDSGMRPQFDGQERGRTQRYSGHERGSPPHFMRSLVSLCILVQCPAGPSQFTPGLQVRSWCLEDPILLGARVAPPRSVRADDNVIGDIFRGVVQ